MRISFADMGQNRIRGNDMDDLISRQAVSKKIGLNALMENEEFFAIQGAWRNAIKAWNRRVNDEDTV